MDKKEADTGVFLLQSLDSISGPGTQLKDIPNVAFKLSKRKFDDNLQMLHMILFGKKAKAIKLSFIRTTAQKEELSAKLCACCNGLVLGKVRERSRKVAAIIQNTPSIVPQETYLLRVLEEFILLL
ncbi:hypothetical protein V6N13_089386 [Hibiscus sabdariffa]|uniref:Uncharacterized protein n=1 Tax=Hibiscus sabdariffa TaxID=183260 RepID=A0ABR2NSM9_9ROSI